MHESWQEFLNSEFNKPYFKELSEFLHQEYENITDINGQINLILCELAFQQGYQLGAKLMLAVFQSNQSENS